MTAETITRLHMTNAESIDVTREYTNLDESHHKPHGLWYSHGYDWRNWCRREMPEWEKKNHFTLEVDRSKILSIKSFEDAKVFIDLCPVSDHKIDFGPCRRLWAGIEVISPRSMTWNAIKDIHGSYDFDRKSPQHHKKMMIDLFFYSLDVSGGVIWDLSAIKSVELVTKTETSK